MMFILDMITYYSLGETLYGYYSLGDYVRLYDAAIAASYSVR